MVQILGSQKEEETVVLIASELDFKTKEITRCRKLNIVG